MLNSNRLRDVRVALALEIFTVTHNALEAIAALAMLYFIVREAKEALEGENCECCLRFALRLAEFWNLC